MGRVVHRIVAALSACVAIGGVAHGQAAPLSFESSGDTGFDAWRDGFAQRALANGRSRSVVLRVMSGLTPDSRVVDADRRQPEFVSPVWDYVGRAVSPTRIEQGRMRRGQYVDMFAAVENRYGVDADIIAGIWAMETNFGSVSLPHEAPRAIATLAYDGRRRVQFETYLLALLEMVERGYAGPNELRSSWAGALGQPQFMPDVYLTLAVDWDGDGRRDIWNNPGDVFASIANYLAQRGWRRGEPVFEEVRLPEGFDYAVADTTMRSVSDWEARGVRRSDGVPWSDATRAMEAQLFLPAGAQGPALLLYSNFQAIKRYNSSDRYALSVSLLARAFEGRGGALAAPWPTHLGSLTRDDIYDLQVLLNAQGFSAGSPDGQFGSNTRSAVRAFQRARGLPADGFPTTTLLHQVRERSGLVSEPLRQTSATAGPPAPIAAQQPSASATQLDTAGIRELQRLLRRLGFRPGPADGSVGERTRDAIRAFERSVGRRVTGDATRPVLNAARRAARRR